MNAKALAAGAAGGVLVLALGAAWFGHRSVRSAEASRAVIEKKLAALDAAARRVEARPRRPAAQPFVARGFSDRLNAYLVLEADPKLLALGSAAYRANLAGRFGRLYRTLGLTPAQIEAFENLMTEHYEAAIDLRAAALLQGLDDSDPAIAAVWQKEEGQLHTAQMALLGDVGYGELQQLNRAQPAADIVTSVATYVALTSDPLSRAQAEQMTQVLVNASSSYQGGGSVDPAAIDWDTALAQAQGVLSAPQFAALRGEYLETQLDGLHAQFDQQEDPAALSWNAALAQSPVTLSAPQFTALQKEYQESLGKIRLPSNAPTPAAK